MDTMRSSLRIIRVPEEEPPDVEAEEEEEEEDRGDLPLAATADVSC